LVHELCPTIHSIKVHKDQQFLSIPLTNKQTDTGENISENITSLTVVTIETSASDTS